MTYRPGTHNPYTVYWDGPTGPSAFVCVALSPAAAVVIADALNAIDDELDGLPSTLPRIPRREHT